MAAQTDDKQATFLETIIDQSDLQTENEAQTAAKVVFRILRDLMPREQVDRVAAELHKEASQADMEIADLWYDPNVMVAFFSRISPLQQLAIGSDTFLLRLDQEGALPRRADAASVTQAVFTAFKRELPEQQVTDIAKYLPDQIGELWQQA